MSDRAMDFWIGEWTCTWEGGSGTNQVEPILGGVGLLERFRSADGFEGLSVSVYDAERALWRQTWVDTDASWIDLTGGPVGADLVLETEVGPTGLTRRMLFSEIEPNALRWQWQARADQGAWETRWEIRYARR